MSSDARINDQAGDCWAGGGNKSVVGSDPVTFSWV